MGERLAVDGEGDVMAYEDLRTNATLMRNCARLGYIRPDDTVIDATYGTGAFWRLYRPRLLITNDLDPETEATWHEDFRELGAVFAPGCADVVVFDPPYKLNGTPSGPMDYRYGVGVSTRWQDRMQLCVDGIRAVAPLARRMLLIKCMDQVCSGQVRWQSIEFREVAEEQRFRLVDMMLLRSGRPQPAGRRQVHARRNYSTLLVMERGR